MNSAKTVNALVRSMKDAQYFANLMRYHPNVMDRLMDSNDPAIKRRIAEVAEALCG